MPFHGITSKVHEREPTRAPRRTEAASRPASEPISQLDVENHEFPSSYDWGSIRILTKERQLSPGLASLIDVACADMGCAAEQTFALRSRALEEPEAVERFCLGVHEERGNIPRKNPLDLVRLEHSVVFWIEGLAGRAVFCAPLTDALRPYDGQTLATHDVTHTPFLNYNPESFAVAKRLPRSLGSNGSLHTGISKPSVGVSFVAADSVETPTIDLASFQTDGAADSLSNLAPIPLFGSDDDAWGLVDT